MPDFTQILIGINLILLKSLQAVIEHVRGGSTVRAFLLPDFYHVTLMMSGVRVSTNL